MRYGMYISNELFEQLFEANLNSYAQAVKTQEQMREDSDAEYNRDWNRITMEHIVTVLRIDGEQEMVFKGVSDELASQICNTVEPVLNQVAQTILNKVNKTGERMAERHEKQARTILENVFATTVAEGLKIAATI